MSLLMMAPVYILFFLKLEKHAIYLLMKADRFCSTDLSRALIKDRINDLVAYSVEVILRGQPNFTALSERSIVLKDPVVENSQIIEKGVFLIKFTATFGDAFRALDLSRLQKWFYVVLEPSWAGYCLPEILSWASLEDKVIVQSSDADDRKLLYTIDTNLIPVSFGSSDWVNPNIFFEVKSEEKIFDAICVANFNSIKRLYVLVNALKKLKAKGIDLKAAIVCASWGDSKIEILDYIYSSDVRDNVTIFEGVCQKTLNILLNRSKVNLLLSLKEGSNRSIFEGFFANTPGLVLEENVGVNKLYINSETGKCIREKELPKTLVHFRDSWHTYEPRSWALKNISPVKTIAKLTDELLKDCSKSQFSLPISCKVNSPEAKLYNCNKRPEYRASDVIDNFRKGEKV